MKEGDSMFDEVIETRVSTDGKLEVDKSEEAQEMEASVVEMQSAWAGFKKANGDYPIAVWGYEWWKALMWLSCAENRLKEAFLGRDRSPGSIKQYHRWRLSVCDGRPFRTNA
jgi:hypothetical protein